VGYRRRQAAGRAALAPTLAALAAASANPDAAARLHLHAQLASGAGDAAALLAVLADRAWPLNMDIFNNSGLGLIKIQPARRAGGALGSVAAQWADDFWLSARTA
jgi:hypothetical protein